MGFIAGCTIMTGVVVAAAVETVFARELRGTAFVAAGAADVVVGRFPAQVSYRIYDHLQQGATTWLHTKT
jgi:hypothetical protein